MLQNLTSRVILCLLLSSVFLAGTAQAVEKRLPSVQNSAAESPRVSPAEELKVVRIAVMAIRSKEKALEEWQPTADYLTEHIAGHKFVVEPLNWEEMREAVANGRADFIVTNPGMYNFKRIVLHPFFL